MRARVKTDELWHKAAIFYELHVRTFADSNADGNGDFVGARQYEGLEQSRLPTVLHHDGLRSIMLAPFTLSLYCKIPAWW